jgi:hypothetical protein
MKEDRIINVGRAEYAVFTTYVYLISCNIRTILGICSERGRISTFFCAVLYVVTSCNLNARFLTNSAN